MKTSPHNSHKHQFKSIDRLAKLLDSEYKIPGTSIRFGLDPIISFFPFLGDLISYLVSGFLVWKMYQHGASGRLIMLMMINLVIDATLGSIPLLGTVFDVYYKANERNVKLLREYYREGKHRGSGMGVLITLIIIFLGILLAGLYMAWLLIEFVLRLVSTGIQ